MIDVISLALSKNYTDKEITKAATSLSFKQKIVESLPSSGEIHTIYFIKNNSSWKDNYYDEYLWIPDTNSFEKIGSTEIPATLPNPNALTFTGAVTGSYDGSNPLTVEIPVGADGKSAYQYAVEGGYTGTEAEFAEKLASELLFVEITDSNGTLSADKSFIEIRDAILAGTTVLVGYDDTAFPLITMMADGLFFGAISCDETSVGTVVIEITPNGEVNDISSQVDIPKTLPNPNAITFTGAVTGSYDGSVPLNVNIPSAVTDAHINSLIDTKLGVIENGSY